MYIMRVYLAKVAVVCYGEGCAVNIRGATFTGLKRSVVRTLIEALVADKFSTLMLSTDTVVVVKTKVFAGAFPAIFVVKLIYIRLDIKQRHSLNE